MREHMHVLRIYHGVMAMPIVQEVLLEVGMIKKKQSFKQETTNMQMLDIIRILWNRNLRLLDLR